MSFYNHDLYIAKGYTSTNGNIPIFWESFNPNFDWNTITGVYDPTTSFDLSNFQHWHEVVATWVFFENNGEGNTNIQIRARKGSFIYVMHSGISYNDDSFAWFSYFWVDYDEIRHNGTRVIEVVNADNGDILNSKNFTVSNLDIPDYDNPKDAGYIWVEWNNICYIDCCYNSSKGFKHIIGNDGSLGAGGETPGMFWVDQQNHWRLKYVSATGFVRRTHKADINGSPGNDEPKKGGLTPGMIRVSQRNGNYAYLTFIGYDGNRYRIMNGPA